MKDESERPGKCGVKTQHDKHTKAIPDGEGHLRAATNFLYENHKEGKVWKVEKVGMK